MTTEKGKPIQAFDYKDGKHLISIVTGHSFRFTKKMQREAKQ
jgi:hypothetical protein